MSFFFRTIRKFFSIGATKTETATEDSETTTHEEMECNCRNSQRCRTKLDDIIFGAKLSENRKCQLRKMTSWTNKNLQKYLEDFGQNVLHGETACKFDMLHQIRAMLEVMESAELGILQTRDSTPRSDFDEYLLERGLESLSIHNWDSDWSDLSISDDEEPSTIYYPSEESREINSRNSYATHEYEVDDQEYEEAAGYEQNYRHYYQDIESGRHLGLEDFGHELGSDYHYRQHYEKSQYEYKESENRSFVSPVPQAQANAPAPSLGTCVICMDKPRECTFLPCGHIACCTTCGHSDDIQTCPICRQLITRVQKVILS